MKTFRGLFCVQAKQNRSSFLDNIVEYFHTSITMVSTKVNRTQLVEALASDMGGSKATAEKFLNSFVEVVTKHLKKGADINITGFGSFRVAATKARTGVNPKTRKPLQIKAGKAVRFKVGKTLKEAVK